MNSLKTRALALALNLDESGALPAEFRLFRAGMNANQNGAPVLFDATAASSVMAAWQRWGVDLIVDLEHDSLPDPERPVKPRPDANDARGWFGLELRGGALWAVNVRWTPDGARRLREKTQRFISPAFRTDEGGRVLEIVNCALCAMPATNGAAPLVAASRGASPDGARARAATFIARAR